MGMGKGSSAQVACLTHKIPKGLAYFESSALPRIQ